MPSLIPGDETIVYSCNLVYLPLRSFAAKRGFAAGTWRAQSLYQRSFIWGSAPDPVLTAFQNAITICYHTHMDEDRLYSGMNEEQIAAYERAERQKAADDMPIEELVATIRQTAYQIHLYLGTGYLEKVYENALVHRLEKLGIEAKAQAPLVVRDVDGFIIGNYDADLIVAKRVVVELKHTGKLIPQHEAQLINYLCTTGIEHGLLINFGSPKFEIKKRIYSKKNQPALS